MSDLNRISQEETSLINDQLKTISISDQKSSTLENPLKTKQSVDENDSEYEDVEEDECDEINDTSILTSITNKSHLKTTMDEDELHINIKPRRINKKYQDDEHSEGYENDDDNQNVPKLNHNIKKTNKNKELIDDDNNTQSPAYIPRKGKFYEHDDRTLNENDRIKQNENRFYKDSNVKWQHDLYFQDQQISKSQHFIQRQNHDHIEHRHRNQLHLNDYISRSQKDRNNYHHQQQYYNDYCRRIPNEIDNKIHNLRINNFDFKDYNHSLSSNRNSYNKDTNIHKEIPRQQRNEHDPYQIDERIFHRRRNFTNSQFQQEDNILKSNNNLSNRKRLDKQSNENNEYRHFGEKNQGFKKYDFYENKNNLPPRFQINNNYRNLTQNQQYQQNSISNNGSNMERSKRYSNMRNNMTNSIQQPSSSSSQIQHYQDQHSNNIEQNDWPQAPPPPTSYLPQQITTPQMYYQQQTSRYVPINYSQVPISEQFQESK